MESWFWIQNTIFITHAILLDKSISYDFSDNTPHFAWEESWMKREKYFQNEALGFGLMNLSLSFPCKQTNCSIVLITLVEFTTCLLPSWCALLHFWSYKDFYCWSYVNLLKKNIGNESNHSIFILRPRAIENYVLQVK